MCIDLLISVFVWNYIESSIASTLKVISNNRIRYPLYIDTTMAIQTSAISTW